MHLIKSTFILSIFALLLPALSGASPAEVPRTGQTACYATAGTVIGCAGTGQDGDRLAGVAWPDPRFTVQTDDQTVTDNLTGLMWTKNANLPNRPGIWQDALNYVADMNAGTHPNFGYTDWRLPNVNELESLVNAELYNPAQPSSHPFTNMSYSYWSSTSYAYYTYNAWIVCMYYGFIYFDDKAYSSNYVWPVRSGQCGASGNSAICLPKTGQTTCHNEFGNTIDCANTGHDGELQQGVAWPDPRFAAKGNGTVPDRLTGLMWAKDANLIATRSGTSSFGAEVCSEEVCGDGHQQS